MSIDWLRLAKGIGGSIGIEGKVGIGGNFGIGGVKLTLSFFSLLAN